ncbi:hypothetical protein K8I28_11585 [bacterium]|nr:hypothetical protein [bacterium]
MNSSIRIFATIVLASLLTIVMYIGCADQDPISADGKAGGQSNATGNQPPETYIHLPIAEDSLPEISRSTKNMRWWGEDIDGRVVAYKYRWGQLVYDVVDSGSPAPDSVKQVIIDSVWYNISDTTWFGDWIETEEEEEKRILPIRTEIAVFTFQVKAIDNMGAEDPTPQSISFPVINSKPTVAFRLESNPYTIADTFYTFTTRTFVWDATDPDGNESIQAHYYAVNPDSADTNWVEIEGDFSFVTLHDLGVGEKTFYLKTMDLAGYFSNTIHFPDSTVTNDPNVWYVKEPRGNYLLVDDFTLDHDNNHLNFYRDIFTNLYGAEGEAFSVWEIKELPYSLEDVTANLMYFDRVIWFSYFGIPELTKAFNSMYTYINSSDDRRLLLTATLIDTGMISGIADSLYLVTNRLTTPPDSVVGLRPETGSDYPQLSLSESVGRPFFGLIPSNDADIVYSLAECPYPVGHREYYEGTPVICIQRPDRSYTLMTIPLKFTNGYSNVSEFIEKLFE